jgi:serine/threonine protein kinase
LTAITLETRLEIVAQVATALAAAHSVGMLHKDVKPGNVLMAGGAEGRTHAQLGDFGIGAITEKQRLAEAGITAMGLTVDARTNMAAAAHGTPLYMAPELLEGKPATMQADIYALGVVLYQVVVGDFARALASGWERDIDDEIVRAEIAAAVDGDPARRLSSAAQLAEQLATLNERRQELATMRQELAERESQIEGARQAQAALARTRRRRKLAAVAVAVLVLFASTVTVQSLRLAQKAREAELLRRIAELERRAAEQVSGFLVELFEEADPYTAQGRDATAREILDRGKTKIDALADQPEVQATLLHVMGVVYGNIGLYQDSAALLEKAVEKRRQLHGKQHLAVADSLHELASTLARKQDYPPAELAAREALAVRRALLALRRQFLGPEHALVAHALSGIGTASLELGEILEARQRFQEALEMHRHIPGDHALSIAKSMYFIGSTHVYEDDLAAAEPWLVESLASTRTLLGVKHPLVAETMDRLGLVYRRTGRYSEAERLLRELLGLYPQFMGEASPAYAALLLELALLARVRGDCKAADDLSRQSLALYRQAFTG